MTIEENQELDKTIAECERTTKEQPTPHVTERELQRALRKANKKSAKGHDGVTTLMIVDACNSPITFSVLLDAINNSIIEDHAFPTDLKTAKVIPLPKDKPNEFRPISLLISLTKIIESIIEHRTRNATEKLFTKNQFGGRPAHNASQALNRFIHAAGMALNLKKHFGTISFDFSKAYDRVPKHRIIAKLKALKCPAYLILIINNWLTDRLFHVIYRNVTSTTTAQINGIPQGSSLSVLLWLIVVNDCPLDPDESNLYVDDSLAWATHENKKELLKILQNKADQMLEWCKKNRVKINHDKVKLIFNQQTGREHITIDGVHHEATPTLKYLGMIFKANTMASASTIMLDLSKAAQEIRQRCQYMKGVRAYNLNETTYRALCQGFIGGKLNYYTPFLSAEIHSKEILRPLQKAYNEYMRTGAFPTTPIPLLHAMSRFPTLSDKIKTDSSIAMINAIANGNLMAQDLITWDRTGEGWTPYGPISSTIAEATRPEY